MKKNAYGKMKPTIQKVDLREWVPQTGSILQTKNRMAHTRNVEEVVEKKRKNYPKCVPIAKASSNDEQRAKLRVVENKLESEYRPYRNATFWPED